MSFSSYVAAFAAKVKQRSRDVFVGTTLEVQRSMVEGSELTGAPGQPAYPPGEGALQASFIPGFTSEWTWESTTDLDYADDIENGIGPSGPLTLRAPVGGFGSVAKTEQGWPAIVEHVAKRVVS